MQGMTTTQSEKQARKKSGTVGSGGKKVGGQFDFMEHPEAGIAPLGSMDEKAIVSARGELLASEGFIPAAPMAAVAVPASTSRTGQWWDRSRLVAEYQDTDRYEQMPDDYTPARTYGNALSGRRRTHRMKYAGAGMELRMPSATAVRDFAANHGNRTFDVPVGVSVDGGTAVQRMVRVTKVGPHDWVATPVGSDGTSEEDIRVGEAVSAVLESRRVTTALSAAGDLLARHRERKAAEGTALDMEPVVSSWIDSIGYNDASGTMATRIGEKVYTNTVPRAIFDQVHVAERPGSVFNKLVKGNGPGVANQCPSCGRFTSATRSHRCPETHKHKEAGPRNQAYLDNARIRAAAVAGVAAPRAPAAPVPAPAAPAAPAGRAYVPSDYKPRGPVPIHEARGIISELTRLKPGEDVIVDGKLMKVQEPSYMNLDHPDSRNVFRAGYGPGRYNADVNASRISNGYVDVQIPPRA